MAISATNTRKSKTPAPAPEGTIPKIALARTFAISNTVLNTENNPVNTVASLPVASLLGTNLEVNLSKPSVTATRVDVRSPGNTLLKPKYIASRTDRPAYTIFQNPLTMFEIPPNSINFEKSILSIIVIRLSTECRLNSLKALIKGSIALANSSILGVSELKISRNCSNLGVYTAAPILPNADLRFDSDPAYVSFAFVACSPNASFIILAKSSKLILP